MATLQECLNQLPDDMQMIDLTRTGRDRYSIAECKAYHTKIENGFEVRDEKYDFGRKLRKAIGIIGGQTFFRQDI
jgi:hypothetical protein